MDSRPRMIRLRPGPLLSVVLLTLAGGWLCAAQAPAEAPAPAEPLRIELQATTPLYQPEGPVWVRFLLVNTSAEPVTLELPATGAPNTGVSLPLELALGSPAEPAVSIQLDDEAFATLLPPETDEPGGTRTLCLGPRGSLGTDIDLRAYWPHLRYTGRYMVEWSPLNGRLGTATARFKVAARKDAVLVTDLGKLTFKLAYDTAPRNVENFLELVEQGFYARKTFHRVIPGFVLQGGCPKGDGSGLRSDGRLVPAEFRNDLPVDVGTLLMARKPSDPNSASCQFFIALARLSELDGHYTVIGQAGDEESLRTLKKLAEVPVDRRDRPVEPLLIRSINLVEVEQPRTRRLEFQATEPAASEPSNPPTTP